jgi:hypothetical protein
LPKGLTFWTPGRSDAEYRAPVAPSGNMACE